MHEIDDQNDDLISQGIIKLTDTDHLIRELEDIRDSQDPLEDLAITMDALRALERHGDVETALEAVRRQRDITENALRALEARERAEQKRGTGGENG